jgi:hypothetical protein
VHLAAFPPVSSSDSCAKGFGSCLINGGDFTVRLFHWPVIFNPSLFVRAETILIGEIYFPFKWLKDPTE